MVLKRAKHGKWMEMNYSYYNMIYIEFPVFGWWFWALVLHVFFKFLPDQTLLKGKELWLSMEMMSNKYQWKWLLGVINIRLSSSIPDRRVLWFRAEFDIKTINNYFKPKYCKWNQISRKWKRDYYNIWSYGLFWKTERGSNPPAFRSI